MKKSKRPKKRGARGTGTVFFSESRGVWVARKPVGSRPGRTLYVERTGHTQREAIEARDRATPPGPTTTVKEWVTRWLAELDHRPNTIISYTCTMTHYVVPALGGIPVCGLTVPIIESAIKTWCKAASANYVRLVLSHLKICLRAAVRVGLIPSNPAVNVRAPRATHTSTPPFTPTELARIVASATNADDAIIAVIAATGCRRGEAVALQIEDVSGGMLAITKTSNGTHVGPPKSRQSERTIRVPTAAREALRLARGNRTTGPLFPTTRNAATVNTRLARVLARLGLPARTVHHLRHSVATHLIAQGCPLGDVAAYLGHTVSTLVKTYVHASGSDPASYLDGLLGVAKVEVPARKPQKAPRK